MLSVTLSSLCNQNIVNEKNLRLCVIFVMSLALQHKINIYGMCTLVKMRYPKLQITV